ncbi:heterokaryon incompatibility protein [Colletotrichum scovillei]|uniref:Heterokaryon incompatibility protein n=1 Tax=Colletotrichum scovillei TaxID=1209932 RepID=A0A9P7UCN5_9PEZI|nr:heterokaryon incompatibility protein [Colletotrichum scovillei]KAF4775393.1 heterokaryon incompatibility protein [Colletotrichum scovillei]KAG7042650.1 heterokaryon incompatibility protein [Colletotrichum scovillei]KAG7043242.1 heterokaryon incompatibility protein [Colletotrichum scovillei]KAG7062689.1 heterokaryon incompatibility protein [Colletotrichum scovillei]
MAEWHDPSCRRLDVFTSGDISSCLSCGSIQLDLDTPSPPETHDEDENAIDTAVYEPLKSQTDIRLLTLEPGEFADPIRCTLALSSTASMIDYDAISYTWASEDGAMAWTQPITLDGRAFLVTANCETALRRVRSRGAQRVVWIDAVCMNQQDVEERGHQVRLMPQIYSRAQRVLVYVGEPVPEEEALFRFLDDRDTTTPDLSRRLSLQQALETLLTRRYFSRAWILQEVALARRATLICGRYEMPWSRLQIPSLADRGLLINTQEKPRLLNVLQLPSVLQFRAPAYRDSSDLLRLLDLARNSHASDPRDKLFAVYGLISCAQSDGIVADYTMSAREAYMQMAKWIAQRFGIPALLLRSFHVGEVGDEADEEDEMVQQEKPEKFRIPSWTPNWTHKPSSRVMPLLTEMYDETAAGFGPVGLPISLKMAEDSLGFPAFKLGKLCDVLSEYDTQARRASPPGSVVAAKPWPYTVFEMSHEGRNKSCDQVAFVFWTQDPTNPQRPQFPEVEQLFRKLPGHDITAYDAGRREEYQDLYVYLAPKADKYDGFSFEEPGSVSVCVDNLSCVWIHDGLDKRETEGRFSKYAICARDLGRGDIRIAGLLHMDGLVHEGVWKSGQFENVSLVGEDLGAFPARGNKPRRSAYYWEREQERAQSARTGQLEGADAANVTNGP